MHIHNPLPSPSSILTQVRLPLHDLRLELDQEDRLPGPQLAFLTGAHAVRRDPRREARAVAHALDDACHKRRAVQLAHLLGHADVLVDQRLVVRDHVLVWGFRVRGFLEVVGGPREEVLPDDVGDELEQGDDVQWTGLCAWGLAVEQEVEELETDGMALSV